MDISTTTIAGPLHRLINSRYPPVGVFDSYVDNEEELQEAFLIENLTNPRVNYACLLYTSPSPRDQRGSRMPSSA